MDAWTIFSIALAAVVVALVLAYVLKSRLGDNDVWEELVEPHDSQEDSDSDAPVLHDSDASLRAEESLPPGVQPMPSSNSIHASRSTREGDLRRSSRVENPVPLVVLGTNRRGEPYQERTSALSFNLHGCRYASRNEYPVEGWVTLQVTGTEGAVAPPVRARVRSVLSPQSPRELWQVAVELETPGNIWGLPTPPEDWRRLLASSMPSARAAAVAPAFDPSAPPSSYLQKQPSLQDRRAEVTVFPSPAAPNAAPEPAASREPAVANTEHVTVTPDQFLQALQAKLQQAAGRAVQTAISTQLEEAVRSAFAGLDDGMKSNLRQTEQFFAARLTELQNRWERELVVYRSRAEEISRRTETLAASARQGLLDLQKFAERIKNEVEPQLNARLDQSLARVSSEFETKAAQLSEQRQAQFAEFSQGAALQARSQLDEIVAEARKLFSTPPAPPQVSADRLEALVNSAREQALNRMEERLSETRTQFEQQQDLARHRSDELTQHLEMLTAQLHEAKAQHEQACAEIRAQLASASSPERFDSMLNSAKEHIFNHLEWRLGEVSGHADQQHNSVQQRTDELSRRVDSLVTDTLNVRAQQEQSMAEIRARLANVSSGVSQERLDGVVNSVREQILNHFEWRLSETSARFEQQHDAARQRSEETSQRLHAIAGDMRAQLDETRKFAENLVHELRPSDLAVLGHLAERATKEFEATAARISDRQLIHLTEQKQALSSEAALELEAQASESRALLQKATNAALEEFQHRVEVQSDLIASDAADRIASSLASLDAQSRAACEARNREVEIQVARAAEQCAAEFRSGIKAFLYSCLVAAVSAVDQHAQTTLAGLAQESNGVSPALDAPAATGAGPENRSAAASASSSSQAPRS